MEECIIFSEQLVHLSRLALTGRPQDIQLFIRRMTKKLRASHPDTSDALTALLRESPTRASPVRQGEVASIPVDLDTRLQLVRVESPVVLPVDPIYNESVSNSLAQLISEHKNRDRLEQRGLIPTRTSLFTGPPGVGKTLGARWIAHELKLPLLILDLSAVMSSFLGRTGNNVRHVLDYAKSIPCVLLLDEFDAIAKRRDDGTEVGELKRLVAVLLQEIDDWPSNGLLIGATNHSDLLDPAVWRRFEHVVEFDLPNNDAVKQALKLFLDEDTETVDNAWLSAIAVAMHGSSFSDIERVVMFGRRAAALEDNTVEMELERFLHTRIESLDKKLLIRLAAELVESGATTQRRAHELTGISRDTIRRQINKRKEGMANG